MKRLMAAVVAVGLMLGASALPGFAQQGKQKGGKQGQVPSGKQKGKGGKQKGKGKGKQAPGQTPPATTK